MKPKHEIAFGLVLGSQFLLAFNNPICILTAASLTVSGLLAAFLMK